MVQYDSVCFNLIKLGVLCSSVIHCEAEWCSLVQRCTICQSVQGTEYLCVVLCKKIYGGQQHWKPQCYLRKINIAPMDKCDKKFPRSIPSFPNKNLRFKVFLYTNMFNIPVHCLDGCSLYQKMRSSTPLERLTLIYSTLLYCTVLYFTTHQYNL